MKAELEPLHYPYLIRNNIGYDMDIPTRLALACIASALLTPFSIAQTLLPSTSTVSCSFDRHSAVKPPKGSASDFNKASTYLAFTEGKTSAKTWKLDGAIRATNSNIWYRLYSNYNGIGLIGDSGDLLVIWAKPEDEVGIFTASLQWSNKDMYAFTSLGQCSLER